MRRETWLRSNIRAHWLGSLPAMFLIGCGSLLAAMTSWWLRGPGVACLIGGALLLAAVAFTALQPRLAYGADCLLVYLRAGSPISVPIDVVECFFLGQAPSQLGGPGNAANEPTASVVVRLAESALDWKQRSVNPRLGRWCDGYITIRGTWCEPLNPELLKAMNHKLAVAHREQRALKA